MHLVNLPALLKTFAAATSFSVGLAFEAFSCVIATTGLLAGDGEQSRAGGEEAEKWQGEGVLQRQGQPQPAPHKNGSTKAQDLRQHMERAYRDILRYIKYLVAVQWLKTLILPGHLRPCGASGVFQGLHLAN